MNLKNLSISELKNLKSYLEVKTLFTAAKHNIDEQKNEVLISTKKTYEASELFFAAGYNYDAKVGNIKATAIPVNDKIYMADALIGKPVTPMAARTIGFEKPVIGIPNPTHTQVGLMKPVQNNTPGSLVDLQEKNALKNTGLQPDRLKNDNLVDNVSVPGPQIVASVTCANCAKSFVPSQQTFQRKNSIDFYEVARTDDMHQCPQCKSIIDRQGYMLHPPQIIDFGMSCPSCRSSQWRLLNNEPEKADVKCMSCAKNYHLTFKKEDTNNPIKRFNFLREGYSNCPQCGHNIPYSTISSAEVKSLTCPKCDLHYGIDLTKSGNSRKIERANEYVQQEDYMNISPTGGTGQEMAPQSASVKKTAPKQKFVPRTNQQIVDVMASNKPDETTRLGDTGSPNTTQNNEVDNPLTKNLKTVPNKPMNEGAIYLVRHGKTKLNNSDEKKDNDKIRGWINVPLDKEGKQESRELGQIFKGHAPDKIYSSDLKRARETADQISLATKVPVISKFDLRPWNLGIHQGKNSNNVGPAIQESAIKTPNIKVKGGESFNNFRTRALNMARKLIDEAKQGKKIVAVTHTRVAKLIQAWIAAGCPNDNSIDHKEFMNDTIKTGSIHKIEPTDNGVKVTEIENLQQSSIIDNTAVSSKEVQGGNTKMENEEIKKEVPATVEETQVVAPVVEATPAIEDATVVEVEDGEAIEAEELLEVSKTLKAEDRNALPNDNFAVVKTVKDKKTGGTRTIRKYPIHDKAHVQNALARLHQEPSREGLKKLGVSPDAVIEKVKAKGKKLGMETAEMEGYCVSSKGHDMQTVVKRGKDDVQEKTPKDANNYVGASVKTEEPIVAKKEKVGDESVEGLTPDQVNQMQNQLFANIKKAMTYRKAHKASMKNIKALKKAMMDGVYASVEDVEVVMNMNIDGKKTTTVSDVGTGEKVTEAVNVGKAPVPVAEPICVDNNDGKEPKALAEALIPAASGEKVEVIVAPAAPVANAEVPSKGTETPVSNPDGEKVSGPIGTGSATEVPSLSPVETTKDGSDTEMDKASIAKENESLKEKIKILETAAVKLIERRNALGEFGKDLSDKDIIDDDKFEVAKIKAENKALKHELNTSSAHLAETSSLRGDNEMKELQAKIKAKAQKLY